jgi:hypothetical protein
VQEKLSGLASVSRAFDIVSAKSSSGVDPQPESLRPVMISAAANYLDPHRQFLLYDGQPAEVVAKRSWELRFDPRDGYPAPVLRALFALLSEPRRTEAKAALDAYEKALDAGPELKNAARRDWSRNISRIQSAAECAVKRTAGAAAEELSNLPGICEAVGLRRILGEELIDAFQVFQRTSTLDDWPPRNDIDTLFRLGQILTYKQWRELQRSLEAPP